MPEQPTEFEEAMNAAGPRSRVRSLSGWGNFAAANCKVYRPERVRDVRQIIARAQADTIISRGLGRSYSDAAVNAGGVIQHTKLDRLLSFDVATALLECEAGVSFDKILTFAIP